MRQWQGRKETVDDSEILQLFTKPDGPVLIIDEIAEDIGFSTQGTLPRLHSLTHDGLLNSKDGGRSIAWWITDQGREVLSQSNSVNDNGKKSLQFHGAL